MITKLRITLKSFDSQLLNISCKNFIKIFQNTESKIAGPIALPTKIKRFCVLRSPHVNKDSREHFEIKFHKRIIDIETNSAIASDRFLKIKLPAGVLFLTEKL
jgi:small subunit ribosomal protein S10